MIKRTLFAIGVLMFTAQGALAKDFCAVFNSTHFVGKTLVVPAKGTCKAFYAISPDILGFTASGDMCTSTDNTTVLFTLSDGFFPNETLAGTFAKIAGTGTGTDCTSGGTCNAFTVTVQACSPAVQPIPATTMDASSRQSATAP